MIAAILIASLTCLIMILAILFFPRLKIGKYKLSTYWLIALTGAALMLAVHPGRLLPTLKALTADSAVNPLKILLLFLSMTFLSVFLDELGFFRRLAALTLKKAKASQTKLFLLLYLTVSLLTVFTSNDVIILSFTPFICYFAKNARISPLPYLAAEFVAANTWSMALVIGNPTNIYLATACGIDFLSYLKVMLLPTLAAGGTAFLMLWLLFRKRLARPLLGEAEDCPITDRLSLWVGILHLAFCTIALALSSYLGIEMWLVSLFSAASLLLWQLAIAAFRRQKPALLSPSLKRVPWELVPFVLSMFILIVVLADLGVTAKLAGLLNSLSGSRGTVFSYGISSFFAANLINNIPMSVLFSRIIETIAPALREPAVYATVVGSNLGAFFSPIGALAGIMWSSILASHRLKFGYRDFLKLGITTALPTLAAALLTLFFLL